MAGLKPGVDAQQAAQNRERVVDYLKDASITRAIQLVDDNPWLCADLGVDLVAWSRPVLDGHGLTNATLRFVGSAAVGFSLSPEHPGRPFRKIGGKEKPSDLDLAVVDNSLFVSCWEEIVGSERLSDWFLTDAERRNVYWGRIDDYRVPKRTTPRLLIRQLLDSVRRSPEFRGYPANVRIYRRKEDLNEKVLSDFRSLSKSMAT